MITKRAAGATLESLLAQMQAAVDLTVRNFHTDFTEHDTRDITKWWGTPARWDVTDGFLWATRQNGTHLTWMPSNYRRNDRIKHLFGYATPVEIMQMQLEIIKDNGYSDWQWHYYNRGLTQMATVSQDAAALMYQRQLDRVIEYHRRAFNTGTVEAVVGAVEHRRADT